MVHLGAVKRGKGNRDAVSLAQQYMYLSGDSGIGLGMPVTIYGVP